MKKHVLIILAVLLLVSFSSAVFAGEFDNTLVPGLNITDDVDLAFNASQTQNRPLIIIFDQDSCVYCDIFKQEVLSNVDVQNQLNENFVVLLVDVNRHPDIAQKYSIFGTPAIIFLDSAGKIINKIEGCPDASGFLNVIKGI